MFALQILLKKKTVENVNKTVFLFSLSPFNILKKLCNSFLFIGRIINDHEKFYGLSIYKTRVLILLYTRVLCQVCWHFSLLQN